jgi:hypothetical protein
MIIATVNRRRMSWTLRNILCSSKNVNFVSNIQQDAVPIKTHALKPKNLPSSGFARRRRVRTAILILENIW